ncbi:glycerophosphodiester phosphodiesterase [Ramlibacter sp. USB13]|uniref:glycerophosphodiester phosphodiesterase n=1 Tax=Ramlibacter cellulosilyticus TaxID=2764187 RepID=A0A923MV10_9BURK|nr:glycerophosphodiester phosphodiesterase [Ramlibacter cellulosilyticus]MBC5785159.1 glycerophosphodiester phosphodiesterase [Ramlibacter cellulosilyticus]
MDRREWLAAAGSAVLVSACGGGSEATGDPSSLMAKGSPGKPPLVIGHRGASGLRPEHTLASYQLAIEQGADFIEPDLVLTKDGFLVARHEPVLDATTDVSGKFPPSRKSTRNLDGVPTTAYFASDFTLAEIKTLRAVQPNAARPQQYNGLFEIPTLDEVIALAKAAKGRVGIYPEIKHSTFHAVELGFGAHTFEDKLLAKLHAAFGKGKGAPVFIQSFEVANLQYLRTKTNMRLVQLVDADDVNPDGSMSLVPPYRQPYDFVVSGDPRTFADLLTPAGLDFVKTYADAIGPWKPYLVKTVADGVDRTGDGVLTINDRRVDGSTGVIELAHARGLDVHTWTFRNDASGYGFADPQAEMAYYMRLGVDGLFTDFPATGVAARDSLR